MGKVLSSSKSSPLQASGASSIKPQTPTCSWGQGHWWEPASLFTLKQKNLHFNDSPGVCHLEGAVIEVNGQERFHGKYGSYLVLRHFSYEAGRDTSVHPSVCPSIHPFNHSDTSCPLSGVGRTVNLIHMEHTFRSSQSDVHPYVIKTLYSTRQKPNKLPLPTPPALSNRIRVSAPQGG